MDGRLYMNAAGYYQGLPGEQGDPLEASLAYGMGIYANWLLPSDIAKSTVVISKRMIEGHGCTPAGSASYGTTRKMAISYTAPSTERIADVLAG